MRKAMLAAALAGGCLGLAAEVPYPDGYRRWAHLHSTIRYGQAQRLQQAAL
jgi:hypothetical protein